MIYAVEYIDQADETFVVYYSERIFEEVTRIKDDGQHVTVFKIINPNVLRYMQGAKITINKTWLDGRSEVIASRYNFGGTFRFITGKDLINNQIDAFDDVDHEEYLCGYHDAMRHLGKDT